MGKKLPKNCRDWHQDLIRCATARYNSRVRLRRKDYGEWMKAKELLNASTDPIYIQPTGQYKGQVVGIPKKIGPNIYQYLCDVVKEARPVIHPEDEAQPLADFNVLNPDGTVRPQVEQNEPTPQIESIPWVVDRKYRDSAYSVLASMYTQLRPERHLQLKTSQVTSGMRGFTDLEIEFDYRTRKNGAFKAMDQLVDKGLVHKTKNGGFTGGNYYSLTRNGLRVCYYLFHVKFSPTANPTYALVRPIGNCVATAEGDVQATGAQAGLPRIPFGAGGGAGVGFGDYNHNNNVMYTNNIGVMHGADFDYEEGNLYDDHVFYGGSGVKKAGASGVKRAYDDLDYGDATYTLDADEIRNKRLKHFGHIATPTAKATTGAASSAKNTTTSSSTHYSSTPTSGIHNPVHHTQSTTSHPTPYEYTDNNQTDSQAAAELEEIQLQSILAYSEQEARLEALYREEQRMIELQEGALNADTYNSADEYEEGEYEIRQEIYYKGQRVPDNADLHSSTAGAKSSDISSTAGSSAKFNTSVTSHNKYTDASMAEVYNAKPSAYDHYNNGSSSSSSTNATSVINLDSLYTTSLSTSKPIDLDASTKQTLIYSANNSDNDSDDEDYQRAIAESMRTDPVMNSRTATASSVSHSTNKHITTSSTNATATLYDTTPAMDTSLDDVIYVETPHKATSSIPFASTTRIKNNSTNSQGTPSNSQKSPRMHASTAPKEIITVVDESQEDSQDVAFCSPVKSTAKDTSKDTTSKVHDSFDTDYSSKKSNAKDVVIVDTPPSLSCGNPNTNTSNITKDSYSNAHINTSCTPLPTPATAAPKPVVYELDDSQNDISIHIDAMDTLDTIQADSHDVVVVVLPVPPASVMRSAVKGKSSTSSDTPEVRTTHDSGSALARHAITPHTSSVLSTVFEVDDTPPSRREEVITIDDSQSPDPYPEQYHYREACSVSVQEYQHQSLVYSSDASFKQNNTSTDGAGKVRKSSAMLAAYATLAQPSPAVTKSSAVQNAEAGASIDHTIQYTPIYLSTTSTPFSTTVTHTLPLCTIPHALVPAASNKLVLLVDVRERNRQAFYRTFFFDIQAKCNTHLTLAHSNTTYGYGDSETITDYSVEQDKLELGDIAVAYEVDSPITSSLHSNTVSNKSKKGASLQTSEDEESDTANSTYYLTGLIVERKALTDLISSSAGDARSRCGTARHFVQECRMRHSGCKKAFMCIEGSMNMANIHAVPLVWRDRDYTHPDIIENVEGIVSYMCAVIGRNYSVHNVVRVVQSVSPSATSQLFAAMMAVEIYLANTSTIHSNTTSPEYSLWLPCKTDFDKYFRSMGASKRGREAELRQSLEIPIVPISGFGHTNMYEEDREVSAEMIERLVRRFGCWDALLSAYKQCYTSKQSVNSHSHSHSNYFTSDRSSSSSIYSNNATSYSTADAVSAEIRCMLLLCELTVGGTLTNRTNLTTSGTATLSAESSALLQDSTLVWHHARRMLCEEGFLQYNATNNSTSTSTAYATNARHRQANSVLSPPVVQYLDCLYTSVLPIQPCKVTYVTISAAMAEGALAEYNSLDSGDFVCQLIPPTTSG